MKAKIDFQFEKPIDAEVRTITSGPYEKEDPAKIEPMNPSHVLLS